MAESIAFVEDEFVPITEAKISIMEPTFTKSDVVYDTISSYKGYIFRLDDHLRRFEASYRAMQLNPPYSFDEIRHIVAEMIVRSEFEDTCVTLMATRGPFIDLTDRDIRKCKNGLMAVCVPYYWVLGKDKQTTGVNMVITDNQRVPLEAIDAKPLTPENLRTADEAFTSTTAGGITPVTQVDGKTLGNGAPGILTTRLMEEYWRRRQEGWHGIRAEEVLQDRDVA